VGALVARAMTGLFWFDWSLLALSLANGIVLLWLGLTVLLNTERRTPGVALLALGAWLGSAFFAAHTAILASGEGPASAALNLWWEVGWLPLLALPLAWYSIALWYSGFGSYALRRHRLPLVVLGIAFAGLVAMLFTTAGLPSFSDAVSLRFVGAATIFGAPWFLVLYPVYILACLALSFDALLRPAPAPTRQGASARSRARPWLLTANSLMMVVATLVAAIMVWVARTPGPAPTNELFSRQLPALQSWTAGTDSARRLALGIAWIDLLVSALLVGVIFCISYALVQYEVFSGRVLPRRALRRHWREAWLLAAGYGVVVGAALAAGWRPVYSLLLTALLMTLFFALLGWRTFATQRAFVRRLQPFVVSTHLVEEVTAPPGATGDAESGVQDAKAAFAALCTDVLQTDYAALIATGPLATLVAQPLVFPAQAAAPATLPKIDRATQDTVLIEVHEATASGAAWAIALQGGQGQIGVMLLGRRRGDGLYTEEEIAIARATGERLLDLQATAALARRLLNLSRGQWAESQVADRQMRRVLHDEVLPDLHAALILLGDEENAATAQARQLLVAAHRQTADLLRTLPLWPPTRPEGNLLEDLRRLVETEMASRFDAVRFIADDAAVSAASQLNALSAEVLFYAVRELVRNAARHGRSRTERRLTLTVAVAGTVAGGSPLTITVQDDGVGFMTDANTPMGSSQGLALHRAMLAVVGAVLNLEPGPESGVCAVILMAR
jgi:signal transduction histidine kinase